MATCNMAVGGVFKLRVGVNSMAGLKQIGFQSLESKGSLTFSSIYCGGNGAIVRMRCCHRLRVGTFLLLSQQRIMVL